MIGIKGGTGVTLNTNAKTSFSGKVHMENGAVVEGIDVGETLKLLTFFIQSQYPEVYEQFNAIEKIKKS
jgi:hypothetical protein